MIIIPAIDLQQGQVVRLNQGRFDQTTRYGGTALDFARRWQEAGVQCIHMVDLDGAKTGTMANRQIIMDVAEAITTPVQTGGGIRHIQDIEQLIGAGVHRVVVGTRAIEEPAFLDEILNRWPEQIAVSIDCDNGFLTQRGWTKTSDVRGVDFARQIQQKGVKTIIYTDIARDGMLSGPNISQLKEILAAVSVKVIASGGISCLDDVKQLAALGADNLYGVIIGKALYEGKIDINEARRACAGQG